MRRTRTRVMTMTRKARMMAANKKRPRLTAACLREEWNRHT
jgi:hypothetical protein